MGRAPRIIVPGYPHHLILRGNNRGEIFYDDRDRVKFLDFLKESKEKTSCLLYAYCLMKNHVHLLAEPSTKEGIGLLIQGLGSKYVRYFNHKYKRTGTLWEGRFRSCLVSRDEYLLACSRYIELNPVRAGIVSFPDEYPWSSYNFKIKGIHNELLDRDPAYEGLDDTEEGRRKKYENLFKQAISELELKRIRGAVQRGGVLGGEKFREKVASEIGWKAELRPRGRPKKYL